MALEFQSVVDLVGEFLVDLIYSELPSLYPELDSDVASLTRSAVIIGVVVGPSIGRAQYEFFCH